MEAIQVFNAARQKGYQWVMDWSNQQLMPSDMDRQQAEYLELSLIKAWMRLEEKVDVVDKWNGKMQEWDYRVQSINPNHNLDLDSPKAFPNPFDALLHGVNHGLKYSFKEFKD